MSVIDPGAPGSTVELPTNPAETRAADAPRVLFRFAVIADTHVNPSENDRISPFESHRLTNERLRHTVDVLNAAAPEFVIHVGDMVHPVPDAVTYPQAAQRFRAEMERLRSPLHLVPGNHDSGDKPADYVPAGSIRPEYLALYRQQFGAPYYAFGHQGCRFVVINTSLINSDLPEADAQARWLEDELSAHQDARRFLFVHYPPFVAQADEPGHYDNLDEPGRGWLLGLIERHRIEAVFTGHVHNFFLNAHAGTPIWLMPSTAFVRADYAEVFRVAQPPEHENGRNDTAKLGILLVDVTAERIVPRFLRTLDGSRSGSRALAQRDWPDLAAARGPLPTLGIDLRHDWTALHRIPYSSMLDEFRRKEARNDYPILSLMELGVRELRVPLDDLMQPASRARMEAVAALGLRFTVFRFGLPDHDERKVIAAHAHLLSGVEVVVRWPMHDRVLPALATLSQESGVPVALSRFWNASEDSRDGKQIKLLVDHGFTAGDPALQEIAPWLSGAGVAALVFRVAAAQPVSDTLQAIASDAQRARVRAQVHLRLADDSPAVGRRDEHHNAHRTLAAALCSHAMPAHRIFIDTLSDVDRGYFPRVGLTDRLSNPRPAGRALRNLNGWLSERGAVGELHWQREGALEVATGRAGNATFALLLGEGGGKEGERCLPTTWFGDAEAAELLDLYTGEERSIRCDATALGATTFRLPGSAPVLVYRR